MSEGEENRAKRVAITSIVLIIFIGFVIWLAVQPGGLTEIGFLAWGLPWTILEVIIAIVAILLLVYLYKSRG